MLFYIMSAIPYFSRVYQELSPFFVLFCFMPFPAFFRCSGGKMAAKMAANFLALMTEK
ncbi:MAG: hypothetical protein ACTTJE_05095 [Schwartzia sp. (in: firmicutes)]